MLSINQFSIRPQSFRNFFGAFSELVALPRPAWADNSGLGAGLASLQADLSIQDGLLATFQADLSVQDDLPATLQADLLSRTPFRRPYRPIFPSRTPFWRPYRQIFPSRTIFRRPCRSTFLSKDRIMIEFVFEIIDLTCMADLHTSSSTKLRHSLVAGPH